MTIRVTQELRSSIVKYPDQIKLQVQGADDQEAAAGALRRALDEISTLGSNRFSEGGDPLTPNYVGGVVELPSGPLITLIDAPMVPPDEVARIPDIVSHHLTEAGVTKAVLAMPPHEGPLDSLETVPRVVVLRLYRPGGADWLYARQRPPDWPEHWRDEARTWVTEGLSQDDVVHARVSLVQFPVLARDIGPLLDRYKGGGGYTFVSGALDSRLRAVHVTTSLGLAAGGPATDDDEMLAAAGELIGIARRFASNAAYAFITFEPSFRYFPLGRPVYDWYISGQGDPPELAEPLCDEFVLDAFPWQLLGPTHMAHLGKPPAGAFRLPGGRIELPLGELADWLPGSSTRPELQAQGRRLLAPCLLKVGKSSAFLRARWEAAQRHASDQAEAERDQDQGEHL